MASRMVLKLMDYDRDTAQVSFPGPTSASGTYTADLGEAEALADAIEAITLATRVYRDFVANRDEVSPPVAAANPFAQTNVQWVLFYTDNVNGREARTRVPCADLSLVGGIVAGTPFLDLAGTEGAALKTAFEAYVLSEDGNAVTLQSVTFYE